MYSRNTEKAMNAPLPLSTGPYPLRLDQASASSAGSYHSLVAGSSELDSAYPLFLCPTARFSCLLYKNPWNTHLHNKCRKKPKPTGYCKVSMMTFAQKDAGQSFCILCFHPQVLRVGPDLQNLFWCSSANAQPCLSLSSLQLHPLWCWSPYHQQTDSSYTVQALGQACFIVFFPPCSFFKIFNEVQADGGKGEHLSKVMDYSSGGGKFCFVEFFNIIVTGGNWKKDWEAKWHLNKQ